MNRDEVEGVRPNWRDIHVVDLTDAEVAQMSPAEKRWCSDLLNERRLKNARPIEALPPEVAVVPIDIDAGGIALMAGGDRIMIYPGEGACDKTFGGEKLGALSDWEISSNSWVSCLWDRSKVVSIETAARAANSLLLETGR